MIDLTPRAGTERLEAELAAGDAPTGLHDRLVADELRKLRARQEARAIFDAERRPPSQPLDAGMLSEILARPDDPPARVEGLIPADASTVFVAQRKVGKTTLVLNLSDCLLTGSRFLDRFAVRKLSGNVCILNYEVAGKTLAKWADEIGVPRDRLLIVNLRGRSNPLADTDGRAELAALLRTHNVEALIVDTFARAFTGTSQNDAGEVGGWLVMLDAFARSDVGARDLFLTVHAGWSGERTRGSSAIEDWADVIVNLSKDDEERRFLRAMGRDVDVEEDELAFDRGSRKLFLTGTGSRKHTATSRQDAEIRTQILDTLQGHPDGLSGNQLAHAVGRKDVAFTKCRDTMVALGDLLRVSRGGRGGGSRYLINPNMPNLPEPAEPVGTEPTEPPSIDGRFSSGMNGTEPADADSPEVVR